MRVAVACSVCAALASGCSLLRPSPPPPPLPRERVVEAVRSEAESFSSVKDADISLIITETLEGKTHKLPRLGGSLGFDRRRPALYLVAEKLGQTAFWLRATETGFWLALPRTQEVVTGGPAAYAKLPHLIQPHEVRAFFAGPEWLGLSWPSTTMTVQDDVYRFDVSVLGVPYRQVSVDRRMVAVTRIRRYDATGRVVTDISLDDYAEADSTLFPRRLTIDREQLGVTVELRLSDPVINPDINPEAFEPGERPGWTHIDLDFRPLSEVRAFTAE
ncbi:MAG: hypothetical protein ACYTFZ_04345 [Planctomycetota bacterium]